MKSRKFINAQCIELLFEEAKMDTRQIISLVLMFPLMESQIIGSREE